MDEATIAFVFNLLQDYGRPKVDTLSGLLEWGNTADTFIDNFSMLKRVAGPSCAAYISPWRRDMGAHKLSTSPLCSPTLNGHETLVLQFHMRHFAPESLNAMSLIAANSGGDGIKMRRFRARIECDDATGGMMVIENHSSACLVLPLTREAPYTVLALADDFDPFFHPELGSWYASAFPSKTTWKSGKLIPCGRCTGVTQFLAMVLSMLNIWELKWAEALHSIDSAASSNVSTQQLRI
jgi:hypothetical protein